MNRSRLRNEAHVSGSLVKNLDQQKITGAATPFVAIDFAVCMSVCTVYRRPKMITNDIRCLEVFYFFGFINLQIDISLKLSALPAKK